MTTGHAHRHYGENMLSVEEALERVLLHVAPLASEDKPLVQALGQVLADDIIAPSDVPPLHNSSMDGYAVNHEDICEATIESPQLLRVIGQLAAGQIPQQKITPGTAIRIMTGAPIPEGATAVVPFEDTDELRRKELGLQLQEISIQLGVGLGAFVRPAGADASAGEVVLNRGCTLRPAELGVIASLGYNHVRVIRSPRVAIIATGNELLEPGTPLEPGMIYDSNSISLAAAVLRLGAIPEVLGIARDDMHSLDAALTRGIASDLVLTAAGVSKGDYDIVKQALIQRGQIDFWSVRMRPAKPLAFGTLEGHNGLRIPHLGLPGNPVSALIAFEAFARPAILTMQGKSDLHRPTVMAILEDEIENNDGRRVYARVQVTKREGVYYACTTGAQDSNLLTSLAKANGLAICPENLRAAKPGQLVQVQMLDWPEDRNIK